MLMIGEVRISWTVIQQEGHPPRRPPQPHYGTKTAWFSFKVKKDTGGEETIELFPGAVHVLTLAIDEKDDGTFVTAKFTIYCFATQYEAALKEQELKEAPSIPAAVN